MSDHHDTVVVKEGGSSTGVIVGIIALILVLGAGWYFLLGLAPAPRASRPT